MQKTTLTDSHLTPRALARRWNMTIHTLGQWRWKGHGPQFFKLGGCIRYRQEEVEKFEACTPQVTTADAKDKCFLCIHLESIVSKEKEECTMSP